MNNELLNRQDFKKSVFYRDNYKCVICGKSAVDAHHIIDRNLWNNGGYYLDNGVSLCSKCHYDAELTLISCEELRNSANIHNIILPHDFTENIYDKWGNVIINEHSRIKGRLFYSEQFQKIMKKANLYYLFNN